jgi:hypothetical protein
MRMTGLSQHTIEAIRAGKPVRRSTLKRMLAVVSSDLYAENPKQ